MTEWKISMPEYSYFYEKDPATGKNICVYTADVYFMIESEGQQWNIWHEKYREADVIRTEIAALDAKIQNIADVVKDENPVKQMKYFNEWLTKNNEYNHLVGYGRIDLSTAVQQIPDSFECTAALSGWTGDAGPVCESYARAFKMLCDYVGIPCVLVDGVAYNGAGSENHMWNYVEAEGKWYAVDCTWNDPLGGDTVALGYSEEILLTAEVEIADVPETDLQYEWYQVDANGGETLLEGENGSQFKFPVGKNAGTYTYRVKVSYEGSTGQADVQIVVRSSVADIFSDVKAGAWYTPYVQFVYDQGLMSGSKGAWYTNAVEWSVGTGIINGKDVYDSNGKEAKDLAPLDGATRAQLAAMLQRYCDLDVL